MKTFGAPSEAIHEQALVVREGEPLELRHRRDAERCACNLGERPVDVIPRRRVTNRGPHERQRVHRDHVVRAELGKRVEGIVVDERGFTRPAEEVLELANDLHAQAFEQPGLVDHSELSQDDAVQALLGFKRLDRALQLLLGQDPLLDHHRPEIGDPLARAGLRGEALEGKDGGVLTVGSREHDAPRQLPLQDIEQQMRKRRL